MQVRLTTFLRLMTIKWLCFILLETDHWARAPQRSAKLLAQDVLIALGPGTALPLVVAVLLEASAALCSLCCQRYWRQLVCCAPYPD